MLGLSTETLFTTDNIGGTIMIYMDDGNVITLTNRIYKDHADKKSTVIYTLNSNQISKLKTSDINKIRYNVITMGSKDSFTGENRYNVGRGQNIYDERNYETAREIIELLEE